MRERPLVPEFDPGNLLQVPLRPYQRQGLGWMLEREALDHSRVVYTAGAERTPWRVVATAEGKKYYYNEKTNITKWDRPSDFSPSPLQVADSVRGGILADEMGMGKTLQMLALMAVNQGPTLIEANAAKQDTTNAPTTAATSTPTTAATTASSDHSSETVALPPLDHSSGAGAAPPVVVAAKTNLVVCPLSLLEQWGKEISKVSQPLTYYTYHGPHRNKEPHFLCKHDVVLTTFATLASEFKDDSDKKKKDKEPATVQDKERKPSKTGTKIRKGLFAVRWFRLILDEAHNIKDKTTRTAHAAFALDAERRWCLSGTPIQNKLEDLYSLLHFLRVERD